MLRTRTFRLLFLAVGLLSLAFFTPFVFLASYADDHGIGPAATSVIVGLIGATSTVGRLLLASIGGGLGEVRMYQLCHALMACSFAVWLFAGSSAIALGAFSVLMGTGYGGFVALAPAVLAREFGPNGSAGWSAPSTARSPSAAPRAHRSSAGSPTPWARRRGSSSRWSPPLGAFGATLGLRAHQP